MRILGLCLAASTLLSGSERVAADGQAFMALAAQSSSPLTARLQRLCKAAYGTELPLTEAGAGKRTLTLAVETASLGDKDYRIAVEEGGVKVTGGSEAALEAAVNRLVAVSCGEREFAVPKTAAIEYRYERDSIDNRALLPPYRGGGLAKLEPSDAAGTLLTPDWVKSLVLVEVHLQTASLGRNFRDGVALLDFYARLGVNALWLTPIYERGPGGNGYGNQGLHLLEPALTGTTGREPSRAALRTFVEEAHRRNLYILLDIISWGTMTGSRLQQEHPDWFNGKAWGNVAFNWRNAEFREWFTAQAVELIQYSGADGFRCDCEPNYGGYEIYGEVRRRLTAAGHPVLIMAEDCTVRKDAFDMEQDGVLDYTRMSRGQLYQQPVNFFADGLLDIVDSCKTGRGLGPASQQQKDEEACGRFRFYPNCITNHDYQQRNVCGDRLKIAYAAILAPFLPVWFQGDEFGLTSPRMVIYFQPVDYALAKEPARAFFMEDVKAALAIRHRYPEIFACWPLDHRETNIRKVTVEGMQGLSAYVRYDGKRAVVVVPNPSQEDYARVKVTLPLAERTVVTDLLHGVAVPLNDDGAGVTATIAPRHLAVLLVE